MFIKIGKKEKHIDQLIKEAMQGYFDFPYWLTIAQKLKEAEENDEQKIIEEMIYETING